jgi:RNA polymerase sigma-70 factor (ECF subfamily)
LSALSRTAILVVEVNEIARAFLSGWRPQGDPGVEQPDRIPGAVSAACDRAAAAWPTFTVARELLALELGIRLREEPDPASMLARLNVEELQLAIACAARNGEALEIFESRYAPDLRATVERLGFDATSVDEAEQNVRAMLFVAAEGERPGILGFGGHGQLRGWLRAVASRAALRLTRGRRPAVPFDEAVHVVAGEGDIELEYLKKTYGQAFESAFHDAFAAMPVSDRLLLKQRFRLGLTVVHLGELHAVHASTVSRWVTDARERLVAATRKTMMDRLGLPPDEMSSVLRLIQSEIDVSLSTAAVHDAHVSG